MLSHTPLLPKGTNRRNISLEPLLHGPICSRRKLNNRMQRHFHPRALFLRHIHIVGIDTSQHGLMRHDNDVFAPFQLHDDGFQPDDHVAIAFTASVSVIIFVVVAGFEVLGVLSFDFSVGEAVADARVEFVEGFPFELVVAFGGFG